MSWGDGLFIFRELWSTDYYFRGAGEQAHSFEDLGSPTKKQKKKIKKSHLKEKASFLFIFVLFSLLYGGLIYSRPHLQNITVFIFLLTCTSGLILEKIWRIDLVVVG